MIIELEFMYGELRNKNTKTPVNYFTLDNGTDMYVLDQDMVEWFVLNKKKSYSNIFQNSLYMIRYDNSDDVSMLYAAEALGLKGLVSFKSMEEELFTEDSDNTIDIYSSKYATKEVLEQFLKPYGHPWRVLNAEISTSRIRDDKREFGLKFAQEGIYAECVYFDFHNFYPNLMLELGAPIGLESTKIRTIINHGNAKGFLNKLIGRFDAEYSMYYDPEYANTLRRFGRMKLLYYILKCDELLLCNTDSILAKVPKGFEPPENTSRINVRTCLIKNIGNYVLCDENCNYKTTGIFNKPEELVIAKERLHQEPSDKEFTLKSLFGINDNSFISAEGNIITGIDRKCRYGKSDKLFKQGLVSIQENV